MADAISNEANEFMDDMDEIINDPEVQLEERRKKDEWEGQCRDIESRPRSGPEAPTDGELLNLIGKRFDLSGEVPFDSDYDLLIKRLSFTDRELGVDGTDELKTAWTKFLDEADTEFDELILSEGTAGWYEEREMHAHAIAVYEHLYTLVRRGKLGRDHFDLGLDSSERSMLEVWLGSLVSLYYYRLEQPERARHLCELIDDYSGDGYVSLVGSAEATSWKNELSRAAITPQFQADLDLARNRLKHEFDRFDDLHNMTKEFVVGAEVWSNNHWMKISPWIVPLRWAQAIESEFHHKVYMPNRSQIREFLGKDAPRDNQGCTLGQIIKLIEGYSSKVGVKCILATMRNSEFLTSQDTPEKLGVVRVHRNQVSHGSEKKMYTSEKCRDFLREIRESNWVFKFLDALQPENIAARN